MPRNDFYPSQKPCPYEKPYDYNDYDNYGAEDNYEMSYEPYAKPCHKPERKPHPCYPCPCPPWPKPCCPCPKPWPPKPEPNPCCPCPCPKPWPPKPEYKKLISAQLSYTDAQTVNEDDSFTFNTFDGISNTNPNAPLYTDGSNVVFRNAGRFIVTYGVDVHLENGIANDVRLGLTLNGNNITPSNSHARNTNILVDGRQTLNKTVIINVFPGSELRLVALQNDNEAQNLFRFTVLTIEEVSELNYI